MIAERWRHEGMRSKPMWHIHLETFPQVLILKHVYALEYLFKNF